MKTSSTMKSLATVVAFAAAGAAQAQPFPFYMGWDREIPPNYVPSGQLDVYIDPTNAVCMWALKSVTIEVDSFTAFGNYFTTPIWSGSFVCDPRIPDCKLPDDMIPMGPLGGPSGLDGLYRLTYKWGNWPSCSSTLNPAMTLITGSVTTSSGTPPALVPVVPDDWSCAQIAIFANVSMTNNTFDPAYVHLTVKGIGGNPSASLDYDVSL